MTSSKRASAELVLNAISETKQRTSQLKMPKSVIALLQKVAEQEEKELFLYSIREELMDRVMKEIYQRYLERQSIKFTVDCAYKALVQVLKTNFFVHDKGCPFYMSHPQWTADKPSEPSVPDSWAADNVKVRQLVNPLTEIGSKDAEVKDDNFAVPYVQEGSKKENQ